MKINTSFLGFALFTIALLSNRVAFAQDEEGSVFVITTNKMVIPDGGSGAERDSLLSLWYKNVTKKNKKILSQRELRHSWGSDVRDWVTITEYRSFGDIDEASKLNVKLEKKYWPNEQERRTFSMQLRKYFPMHSDEIYVEMNKFGK